MHALAHLFGFELLTRIRNWKDRTFYRPEREVIYRHLDSLFGEPGQNAIDWRVIEIHWQDLMRIVISIREVESYNNFSGWLVFGAEGIERNDPAEQEKLIKFNKVLANCVIFHIAIDMTAVVREMVAGGRAVELDDLATMAAYITERIKRFGEYPIDGLDKPPEVFDPRLELLVAAAAAQAA